MTVTYDTTIRAGGGRIEYVGHIGGFPWAVCTHPDLVTALAADTTNRRLMFGDASVTVGVTVTRPADSIPIFPVMFPPGNSETSLDESDGMLNGGDFSIEVAHEDTGYTWTHRTGSIWGLEGVHTLADGRVDPTVAYAWLYETLNRGSITMKVHEDVGGKLQAKITANIAADTPTYIWIGGECVAVRTQSEASGVLTWNVVRGVYRSKDQTFPLEDYDGPNILVTDAPPGTSGRGAYIWAVPMDEAGNITATPIKFRHGMCNGSVVSRDGKTTIGALSFFNGWLKAAVKFNPFNAQMDKYVLSRPPSSVALATHDCAAHILVRAVDAGVYNIYKIWLCDEGDTVTFDTYEDLKAAAWEELNRCSALVNNTHWNNDLLPLNVTDLNKKGPHTDASALVSGPVPWLLNWGYVNEDKMTWIINHIESFRQWFSLHSIATAYPADNTAETNADVALGGRWRACAKNTDGTSWHTACQLGPHQLKGWRSPYMHMYDWDSVPNAQLNEGYGTTPIRTFPVTYNGTLSKMVVHITKDNDATAYGTTPITLGDSERRVKTWAGPKRPAYLKMNVKNVGDNYLEADSPAFEAASSSSDTIFTADGDPGPLTKGFIFYYLPGIHDSTDPPGDPWVIRHDLDAEDPSAVTLLKALLGDTTTITIPGSHTLDHIPDILDDSTDHVASIDWSQLDDMLSPLFSGHRYRLRLDKEMSFYDVLRNELLFHGLSPTWEYSAASGQWIMRFRRLGVVNATTAQNEGRNLNQAVRRAHTAPRSETNAHKKYSKAKIQCNYKPKAEKFGLTLNVENKDGWAALGGVDKTLDIKTKLSWIDGASSIETNPELQTQISEHFAGIMARLGATRPVQTAKCNAIAGVVLGVGTPCIIDDSTAHNSFTGALGLSDTAGMVTAISIDGGASDAGTSVTYEIAPDAIYGWAPAMRVATSTVTLSHAVNGTISITPDEDVFVPSTSTRKELSFFDCLVYSAATDTLEDSGCSCSDYKVVAFEEDVTAYAGASGPFLFTISDVDTTAGTAVLNGDSTSWNTAKAYIIKFADWSDSGLQDCQRNYVYFADEDSLLIDSGATETDARRWV